jgi:acetyltransferase-like isoleucine patch superfamily enzyme
MIHRPIEFDGAVKANGEPGFNRFSSHEGRSSGQPRAMTAIGRPQGRADRTVEHASVGRQASIGSNATILCGTTISAGAIVGPGTVVHAGCSGMRDYGASVCAHPAGVRAGPRRIVDTVPSGRRSCL